MKRFLGGWVLCCWLSASVAAAQDVRPLDSGGLLEVSFTPTGRAQLALWLERGSGEFLRTVRLTEAVAYRGIGNRPGASQMNGGFRWPYGRREGALPVWARRRAAAPGAKQFRTVIFQDRMSEGLASRTSEDQSPDDYYCLSFDRSRSGRDALDAVACASVTLFSSDKGRFLTQADEDAGYAEPYQDLVTGEGRMRPLPAHSLYPPRRDIRPCTAEASAADAADDPERKDDAGDTPAAACFDHVDVSSYAQHVREVMPHIDAVTMATPVGGVEQRILFQVPPDWQTGDYRLCLESNVEGDYNPTFDADAYPTPREPADKWDYWATTYGYPYRGQPSVVYCTDFHIGDDAQRTFDSSEPEGTAGTWDVESSEYGTLRSMDGMTNDPIGAPGSGGDRLQLMDDGYRLQVTVRPPRSCEEDLPPGAVDALQVRRHHKQRQAHQWAELRFLASRDDEGIFRYDVRVSTEPITDEQSFMAAQPAKEATIEAAELMVPTDAAAGEPVSVEFGGLIPQTHYFVAVRPMDRCAGTGPIAVGEVTTTRRVFATVTPCFVATAAWGTPLALEVGVLRRLRDRHLLTNPLGRALVAAYYSVGPSLARSIGEHELLRAVARAFLAPVVTLARWL